MMAAKWEEKFELYKGVSKMQKGNGFQRPKDSVLLRRPGYMPALQEKGRAASKL
jgi:hypothetical protein